MGVFAGKAAVVTGAAQGIGRAIAERFAREGAQVTLVDINDTLGQAVAEGIVGVGGQAQYVHCDVARAEDVDSMIQRTVDAFGGVDILVNNAAIAIFKLMEDYTEAEWDRVIGVNLRSVYLTSRRCIPIMASRGGGSIVSISSVHARATATTVTSYVAAKGGIVSMTRAMAIECAPHKIRVNCILPGAISTPMLLSNWGDAPPESHPLMPAIPLRRFGDPDEIARVAQFLASDESSYMTGSDVLVDGGLSARFS